MSDTGSPERQSAATPRSWVTSDGLAVAPMRGMSGDLFYAEVVPAGSRWLPWFGRTSRWWYEVHSIGEPDEHGVDTSTLADVEGGSGGGFTLRSCIRRAAAAVDRFASKEDDGSVA